MSLLHHIFEATYRGNMGFHEMMQFYQRAPQHLIDRAEYLMSIEEYKQAWKIVQDFLNVKLVGSQFNEAIAPVLINRYKLLHEHLSDTYKLNPIKEQIGSGAEGVVFSMENSDRLIKYTQDTLEYNAIESFIEYKFKYVATYYGILDIPEEDYKVAKINKPTFAIIMQTLEPSKIQPHVSTSLLAITNIVVRKVWDLYKQKPTKYEQLQEFIKKSANLQSNNTIKKLDEILPTFKQIYELQPLLAFGIAWNALFYDNSTLYDEQTNITLNRVYNFIGDVRKIGTNKDNLKGFSDAMSGIEEMLSNGVTPKDTHGGNLLYDSKEGIYKWIDIRVRK
jgi:hypothetical protein